MPIFYRLLLLAAIILLNSIVSYSQIRDSLEVAQNQYTPGTIEYFQNLLNSEKKYYDLNDFKNFLEVKYEIFESLVNDKQTEKAFEHADFDISILTKLQKEAPKHLSNYYDKLLRYSIRNKHLRVINDLALHSLDGINGDTEQDSVYLFKYHRRVGLTYRYLGEYDASFDYLQKSLNLGTELYGKSHLGVANIIYNIGANHAIKGEFNKALEYLVLSKNVKLTHYTEDSLQLKSEFNALGLVYEGLGEYDKALEYHEKTINLKRKHSKKFNRDLGRSYLNLGTLLISMGQPQMAYQKSKLAIDQLYNIGEVDTEMAIWLLNNIGSSLIAMDRPQEAIQYLKRGIIKNKNKFDLSIDASLEENLGMALMKTDRYEEAIKYLTSSKEKFVKDSPDHQRISRINIELSKCYFQKGQYQYSEDFALLALNHLQKKLTKDHPILFQPYYQLGKIYNTLEKRDMALIYIHKIDSLINVSSLDLLKALNLKLEIYESVDLEKFNTEKEEGKKLISKSLTRYIPTEEKYLLIKEIKKYYNLCLRNWDSAINDKVELLDVFRSSKNSMLKASVLSSKVTSYAGVPIEITDRAHALGKKIMYLENLIIYNYEPSDVETSHFLADLESAQLKYESILDTIQKKYPKYFDLKYNTTQAEDKETLDLPDSTAVLDFFIGEENIWILSLYNDEKTITKKPLDNIWRNKLLSYKNSLVDYQKILDEESGQAVYNQFIKQSQEIHDYFIAETLSELPSTVTSLVVIPDGILNFIPFETFLQTDKNTEQGDYRKLDYLITHFSMSYAYSLSLINSRVKENKKTKFNYSGFAPKYDLDTSLSNELLVPLMDLPSARKSVKESAVLFNGKSYLSDLATKSNFVELASESSILQIAMHCIIDNNSPMETKLMFSANTKNDSSYLKASDLYNMELDNQLSVLTACNTGSGNIREGEGVISLSRAFTYAGSPSLVMSLWNVPDVQTATLVKSFFENLNNGVPKDHALQNAKLQYLSEAPKSASHPLYWAGFILSGDTQPIEFINQGYTLYYVISLISVLLIFLCYKMFFNNNNNDN